MKKILVVGGGTAGWMAAVSMQHIYREKNVQISVMESRRIPTVGVGEGSTQHLKRFFEELAIPEKEWMPACNATYKVRVRFPGWSTMPGYESFGHPAFFSRFDLDHFDGFLEHANRRRSGIEVPANPDSYLPSAPLVEQFCCPVPKRPGQNQKLDSYGYHFDAGLLGEYLKKKAVEMGVTHIEDTVTHVEVNDDGIVYVDTESNGKVDADLFVDCTGFRRLLMSSLGAEWVSFRDRLFNDSAVAMQTPLPDPEKIPAETVSRAMKHGWIWHIPLMNRMGNGYVYSSDYATREEAEAEMRELLGQDAEDAKALHLRWQPGRIKEHWKKNCITIGLSQGFFEPLEALMLIVIQQTLEVFIKGYEMGGFTNKHAGEFNGWLNNLLDSMADFIQAHYKTASRDDTKYWRDVRANPNMSDQLRQILEGWKQGTVDMEPLLEPTWFPNESWYCVFSGKGYFRDAQGPAQRPTKTPPEDWAKFAENFFNHAEYLRHLRGEESTPPGQDAVLGALSGGDLESNVT